MSIASEELELQWRCMMEKVSKTDPHLRFSLTHYQVAAIFHICEAVGGTNHEVRFRAVELYDRYLKQFSREMSSYYLSCSPSEKDGFKERFNVQVLLRMSTCVCLASKLHADKQVEAVTHKTVAQFLKSEGFKYDALSVCKSEFRVLDTLNYKCHWIMPLDLVEQLLCLLDLDVEISKSAHYFSLLLLEYFYSDVGSIQQKFLKTNINSASKGKISIPLQTAAIVSAALFIVSRNASTTKLHKLVANKVLLPQEEVKSLALIMLELLSEE